jgi:hypothetical protein
MGQRQVGGGQSDNAAAAAEIPEPSTVTLLILGAASVRWARAAFAPLIAPLLLAAAPRVY